MTRDLLFAPLVLVAALSAACAPTTPPPEDPSTAPSTFGVGDLAPGTHVEINKNGQWLPGTIVQPLGGDRFVVGYDAYGPQWNEAVAADHIRTQATTTAGLPHDYHPGDKVLVTSAQNRVLLADVAQQVGPLSWRVHYDGYGAEVGESVGPERLKRPFVGASAHTIGETVMVEGNGQVAPGKVLALTAADRWLVRFEAYGPQYDQEIGADRIRVAAPVAPPPLPPAPVVAPPAPVAPAKPERGRRPHAPPPPAPVAVAPAPPPPAPPAAPPQVGDAVLVSVRGILFPGAITGPGSAAGQWKVKMDGAAADEEIGADRVVRTPAPLKGVKYQPAQAVLVEWHGIFVGGKVLKEGDSSQYKVRFDGFAADADEMVPAKRLRPKP